MKKYTVIIPAYNAETTLRRCLDSITSQLRDDIEVLIINDGSSDNTRFVSLVYASKYKQIRYFDKENQGVSSARNFGLDNATGEYILFVDSDDYVADTYFLDIDSALEVANVDMLIFGFQNFGSDSTTWNCGDFVENVDINIAKAAKKQIYKYMFSSLWSRVFRRKIIDENNLRFDTKLHVGEDQAFIFSYALHMNAMKSIENTLYFVSIENMNSLSRAYRDDLTEQLLDCHTIMEKSLQEIQLDLDVKKEYESSLSWMFYRSAYSACKELLKVEMSDDMRRKRIKCICTEFSNYKVKPKGFKCLCIAIPVLLRMSGLLNFVLNVAKKRR